MSIEAQASTKTWELSLYELNRTPQEALTDNTEIAVSPRSLHSELMCPICLDMLKHTMTTKECLHRFCHDCIITALRSGNKECPTCRKKLVSKRSLRPDPNFDALIAKIYPSRDEYEAHQERVLAKLNKHIAGDGVKPQKKKNAPTGVPEEPTGVPEEPTGVPEEPTEGEVPAEAVEPSSVPANPEGAAQTDVDSAFRGLSLSASQPGPSGASRAKTKSDSMDVDADDYSEVGSPESTVSAGEVELIFRPHPDDVEKVKRNSGVAVERDGKDGVGARPETADRYIRTTGNATVDHLSKYLAMRIALDRKAIEKSENDSGGESFPEVGAEPQNYTISISSPENSASQTVLSGNWTLEQVHEKYWKSNRPLEMFYKIDS